MPKSNRGEKNGNWNGGVFEYKDHYEMKKARIKKMELVNNCCEQCGKTAGVIHHMDNSKDNHSLSNLLALCYKCHSGIHSKTTTVGRKAKYCRLTAKKIAVMAGCSSATVNYHLSGRKLSTFYGCAIDQIVADTNKHQGVPNKGIEAELATDTEFKKAVLMCLEKLLENQSAMEEPLKRLNELAKCVDNI